MIGRRGLVKVTGRHRSLMPVVHVQDACLGSVTTRRVETSFLAAQNEIVVVCLREGHGSACDESSLFEQTQFHGFLWLRQHIQ